MFTDDLFNPEGFVNVGEWEKTDESDIPERLVFYWTHKDGYKIKCLFSKEESNKIICSLDGSSISSGGYNQIYMDANQEYILKALDKVDIDRPCQDYNYKNTFTPSGKIETDEENFSILGNWKNTQDIPETLDFYLIFDDNTKTKCSFTKEKLNEIKCNGKTYSPFIQLFMDTNREYLLKGLESISPEPDPEPTSSPDTSTPTPASSSFIYFNILILFALILILL